MVFARNDNHFQRKNLLCILIFSKQKSNPPQISYTIVAFFFNFVFFLEWCFFIA